MISKIIGAIVFKARKCSNFFIRRYISTKFAALGKNVYVGNNGIFTYENIFIGDDVYIGANAVFQSSYVRCVCGVFCVFQFQRKRRVAVQVFRRVIGT